MRTIALAFLLLLVAIFSCNGPGDNRPIGGDRLPITYFTIDPTKDTILTTLGGTLVKLPAGTLDANGSNTVLLQVKEAYSTDDMILGNLTDQGNPNLTNSGVLYFNVSPGQNVIIRKPVQVLMATKFPSNGVMVYEGKVGDSSAIEWLDPQPLADNPSLRQLDDGKEIFISNCASCHSLKGEATAPPLAWITTRRDRQWLFDFTRNNAKMLWRGDAYSCYLFNRFNKRPMQGFTQLGDSALESLYRYIDVASRGVDSNLVVDHKRSFDSCAKNDPNCSGVTGKTQTNAADPSNIVSAAPTAAPSFYSFSIAKFGWYNIAQRGYGAPVAGPDPATESASRNDASSSQDQLQACPCWCDESAYRKADSVARAPH
jgi:mono/diheme cytochrome c family protein